MKKMPVLVALVVTLSPCHLVTLSCFGQESPYAEDLQFVRELRNHGYNDLAREYLAKLAKNAPAALKKELPLEKALTEMEAANEEPDSAKRIGLYAEAREQFRQFLTANPTHPRAAEAKFDIARATTLQGKTQLNRARLEGDVSMRIAEAKKARDILSAAFAQLKQLPSSPKTELALALNILDQSDTYLGSDAADIESSKQIQIARTMLDTLGQGDPSSKITWTARAWVGRCLDKQDTPNKAIDKYKIILEATGTAAQEGKRLAHYFMIPARKHAKDGTNAQLISQARTWLTYYPNYTRTAEGFGVQYWLAKLLLEEAENAKLDARTRQNIVAEARRYLSKVERTENEFTDMAKSLKLDAMFKQGTFKTDIDKLTTFEDCFARAQYEQREIAKDVKQFADNKTRADDARKKRMANVVKALRLGLTKPDAKIASPERSVAQALLTFYLLDEGKYKEAIEIGENFANKEPKASQASTAAIYALVAYGELLAERERKAEGKSLKDDKDYQDEQTRMLALAQMMEDRWPKERAGDVARDTIARRLLREDKIIEAIKKLAAITPAYPTYIRMQYLLARAALQQAAADKDKGDPDGYRQLALTTLSAMPDPDAAAESATNEEYIQAKLLLGMELTKDKKLKEVDALLIALAPKLASLKVDDDAAKDAAKRQKFEEGRVQLSLYSAALQADAEFKAAKYAEVAQRLDPLIDRFIADKLPQLKDSGPLGSSIVALDLRANVQRNNLERARVAIKALQNLRTDKEGEKAADTTTPILAQLVGLITQQVEELRKKGDKDGLKKVQAGFTAILNDVAGGQKNKTPKLAYLLARCYSGMDEHKKAVELLKPFAVQADGGEVQLQHAIQLLLIQEYRQLKDTDQAQALLDEVLGKDHKSGWGAKNLEAQKLLIQLMEDQQKYGAAAKMCIDFVNQLVKRPDDNKLKELYFEFYYHLVYCLLKHGQRQENAAKKTKYIHEAAQRLVALEKRQNGFGSDESKKRFDELLEKETDLREQYNTLKGK
jgi:hypothetical protein